jgi:hypothetical protein
VARQIIEAWGWTTMAHQPGTHESEWAHPKRVRSPVQVGPQLERTPDMNEGMMEENHKRSGFADLNRDQKSETPGPIIISHFEGRMSAPRETLMRRIVTIMRTLPARHSIVTFDTHVSRLLRDIPAHSANDARGWPALSVQSASRKVYREALRSSKTGLVIA